MCILMTYAALLHCSRIWMPIFNSNNCKGWWKRYSEGLGYLLHPFINSSNISFLECITDFCLSPPSPPGGAVDGLNFWLLYALRSLRDCLKNRRFSGNLKRKEHQLDSPWDKNGLNIEHLESWTVVLSMSTLKSSKQAIVNDGNLACTMI